MRSKPCQRVSTPLHSTRAHLTNLNCFELKQKIQQSSCEWIARRETWNGINLTHQIQCSRSDDLGCFPLFKFHLAVKTFDTASASFSLFYSANWKQKTPRSQPRLIQLSCFHPLKLKYQIFWFFSRRCSSRKVKLDFHSTLSRATLKVFACEIKVPHSPRRARSELKCLKQVSRGFSSPSLRPHASCISKTRWCYVSRSTFSLLSDSRLLPRQKSLPTWANVFFEPIDGHFFISS